MNDLSRHQAENLQNQYGLKVSARLSGAVSDLPYDITERLRAARVQAVAKRKIAVVGRTAVVVGSGGSATLAFGEDGLGWWSRLVSAIPLVILAVGLIGIDLVQTENRATEIAEVDSALLIDDLPPSAYADSGFVHFLNTSAEQTL